MNTNGNNNPPELWQYVVMDIHIGMVLYKGPSLALAAQTLNPGTCYGRAFTERQAMANALVWRKHFLKPKEETDAS